MASIGGPSTFETGALWAGRRMSVPEDDEADDEPEQNQQAQLLRARRQRHAFT
jgi:hypothetical protein